MKLENLCFEDFLDALTRVATMKALPTDEELEDEGAPDAGEFLLELRKLPDQKKSWLVDHARRWDEALNQPIERAVHHLIMLIVRTVQLVAAGKRGKKPPLDRRDIAKQEVIRFRKDGGLRCF